jgi:hypothetical protein
MIYLLFSRPLDESEVGGNDQCYSADDYSKDNDIDCWSCIPCTQKVCGGMVHLCVIVKVGKLVPNVSESMVLYNFYLVPFQ